MVIPELFSASKNLEYHSYTRKIQESIQEFHKTPPRRNLEGYHKTKICHICF